MAPHSSILAWKIPWMEEPGGLQPWDREELNKTERLHFHFSLSCIGERNGNPLQCSCLESPRDGGVWWAAVSGVTQSRTRLKWLSSSSNSELKLICPMSVHKFSLLKGLLIEESTPPVLVLCFMLTSTMHTSPSVIILLFNGVCLCLTLNTLRAEAICEF